MPCSILFGLAHIDETRGLKQVYETVFGLCFGESFDFKSWKEIRRTGHEKNWKTWVDMRGNELKWKAVTINKTASPKLEKFIYYYYPFTNGLSRFWAPMSYPLPQLTWGFNLVLFQVEVLQQNNLVMLVVFGFGDLLNKWPETKWKGHETDMNWTWKERKLMDMLEHERNRTNQWNLIILVVLKRRRIVVCGSIDGLIVLDAMVSFCCDEPWWTRCCWSTYVLVRIIPEGPCHMQMGGYFMFMWSCRPEFHFLDVNMEGSSLRRGQASTCQDAWWSTWSQLSPRCVWAKHFLVCFRVPWDLVLLTFDWEHTACPCFPCLHWTTFFSTRWVLATRWSMKFALVRTASCSILSNWLVEKKTLPTILHAGTTPSEKRLWILSWTGSASWQIIARVTPLGFGYNFGLNFHVNSNVSSIIFAKKYEYQI